MPREVAVPLYSQGHGLAGETAYLQLSENNGKLHRRSEVDRIGVFGEGFLVEASKAL